MITVGVGVPVLLAQLQVPINGTFVGVVGVLVLAGFWVFVSGKQHCWAFALPLQKRHYLTLSVAFDVAAFICRLIRHFELIGPVAKGLMPLFGLLSLCFLIAFIGYLAKVIDAKIAQLMVWGTWVSLVFTFITSFMWGLFVGMKRPEWTFAPRTLTFISVAILMVLLLSLTATMSVQLRQLSDFLEGDG